MKTKFYFSLLAVVAGLAVAAAAQASVVSGTLTTGLSSGPQVVVTSPPVAAPGAGTYTSTQSVQLTGDAAIVSIQYTTDGTPATCTSGTTYTSAITVSTSETISAISCYADNASSTLASFAYVINAPSSGSGGSSGGSSGGGSSGGSGASSGTISGLVYSDNNANGQFDASDTPLSGWTVYLDTNDIGSLTSGDNSVVSDANGAYSFTVALGSYTVREVLQTSTSSPWGQTQPPTSANNHAYAVTLSSATTTASGLNFGNNALGKVLGESITSGGTTVHPDGTLILSGSTVYLIASGQLHGFRDPQEFASYGYQFSQTVQASPADLLLPQGDIMKAMTGTLALDTSDNRTIYMVGANYTKRGFVSMQVFQGLGYVAGSSTSNQAVHGVFRINMTDYPAGSPITSATDAHPEGSLVLDNTGTIWWILNGQREGFESMAVFNTYGFTSSRVVPANAADMTLPVGPTVKLRDGTLVLDGGVTYIISDGLKLPFASASALTSHGYNLANVVAADVSSYTTGATLN